MTPEDILRLSEYLEALYIDTHSALVLTLARHLKSGKKLTVEDWQSEKLGELTQVIQQCARVIAQGNAQKERAIQITLQDAVGIELAPVDSLLSDAVDAGKAVQPISARNGQKGAARQSIDATERTAGVHADGAENRKRGACKSDRGSGAREHHDR